MQRSNILGYVQSRSCKLKWCGGGASREWRGTQGHVPLLPFWGVSCRCSQVEGRCGVCESFGYGVSTTRMCEKTWCTHTFKDGGGNWSQRWCGCYHKWWQGYLCNEFFARVWITPREVDLRTPTHRHVPCWIPKPLPPRHQCTSCLPQPREVGGSVSCRARTNEEVATKWFSFFLFGMIICNWSCLHFMILNLAFNPIKAILKKF